MSKPATSLTALLALLATMPGCGAPTSPTDVPISIELVRLASPAEYSAWPFTPSVQGGATVTVRGFGPFGCGSALANAGLRAGIVNVRIVPSTGPQICLANIPLWQPFKAELTQLAPGVYRVRISVTGQPGTTDATISVAPQ
jgi:hypothetical protein